MKRSGIRIAFGWCGFAGLALGNGFYIPVQAPEATGRGNAWLASADSAAAVYYNAAGLTQLDAPEVFVGAYSVRLGIEAETPFGDFKNDASWALVPQIYGAVPVNDRLVAGFGLNTPFGLATDWGGGTPFTPLTTEIELSYLTGWAVFGYRVTDEISVGGGLGLHYADLDMRKAAVAPGDFSRFEGDDVALSWTVSARWQPCEQHAFGVVFRSKTNFDLEGDAAVMGGSPDESATSGFLTPATVGVGYAYRPSEEWVFEANVEWVNWDEFSTFRLEKASGDVPLAYEWESNFIYSVGATRYFGNGWNVSAGYNYIENSQPDANFNPGVSDADRHWINVGVGQKREAFEWSFAYQFAFSDRDVKGSPFNLADGTYKSRFHGVMFNCDWKF